VRFCGQALSEGKDKDLGLLCVQAYNDWMVDEWCGEARGSAGRHSGARDGSSQDDAFDDTRR
jgi:hypothetical protein